MRIAIDFDGTIVENRYPMIGKPKLFAFETMKELQKQGDQLILWTYRTGKELQEAVEFCRVMGIEFYAVNKNYPEENYDETVSRKLDADVFIDDRNFGGFPGWSEIWKVLSEDNPDQEVIAIRAAMKKKRFFARLRDFLRVADTN